MFVHVTMSSSFDNKVYEYISNNGSTPTPEPTPTPTTGDISIITQSEGVYQLTLTKYGDSYATLLITATVNSLATESITFSDEILNALNGKTPINCQVLNNRWYEITGVSENGLTYTLYFTQSEVSGGITFTTDSVTISLSSFPAWDTYYLMATYYLLDVPSHRE